ncbi:MAG: DUF488 domain-containing protein, partial [Candidatus Micrarchaeaceae archaeon]
GVCMLLGIKRVYEKAELTDGKRVLIDRLWPRGLKKSIANVDIWLKGVAPSTELRKWFGHNPAKWAAFKERYAEELAKNPEFEKLVELAKSSDITLLYAASDKEHNDAVVLLELLEKRLAKASL